VTLLFGTNKLTIVISLLIGKVEFFDIITRVEPLNEQLGVDVWDVQETLRPLINWIALAKTYEVVIAAVLTIFKVKLVVSL
jgi:hypothetical protein